MFPMHRVLMGVVLLGNAVAFAGVDPVSRAITALLVVVLLAGMHRTPDVPRIHRWAARSCRRRPSSTALRVKEV